MFEERLASRAEAQLAAKMRPAASVHRVVAIERNAAARA
jgi:hypothetical protein